eukprot:CAMPEP_0197468390 /NCGR_PEP_ID=MMETSP1175-20131217/66058_1 /TAXON_ID=1003142 /ORGANISM="Triceratium dubium, Strain CCMP147" /LENGTH=308 /DNA_ID=CAMNT_0043004487 /DNA_START=103 /DNA_END=1026 /DNA_ORIENTATION=+
MEESKIQALHDSLSQLRRSAGLGVSSQYSWSAAPTKTDESGNVVREDGLPTNALYANFLREGSYDRNSAAARKYGDGRVIKRNFDDCAKDTSGSNASSDVDSEERRQRKIEKKERKKAEKKAAKLEAKRQAKLEEKKRLRREAKKAANQKSQAVSSGSNGVDTVTKRLRREAKKAANQKSQAVSSGSNGVDTVTETDNSSSHTENAIKTAKKTLKRQESGSMKIKELARAVVDKLGNEHDIDSVKKIIKKSEYFDTEGKVVRYVREKSSSNGKKKRKREEKQVDGSTGSSSSDVSAAPSSPPPKKRRK